VLKAVGWVGTALLAPIVAGYVVELIKGTPLSKIAAALWALLGAAIGGFASWLAIPAQVTHGRVLLLTLALTVTLAALIAKWLKAQARAHKVPADFNPTGVQLVAIGWMLKAYNTPQSLGQLYDQLGVLTQAAGGKAFLARQMEDLERATVLRTVVCLTF
jgi:hypothetical protein